MKEHDEETCQKCEKPSDEWWWMKEIKEWWCVGCYDGWIYG